MAVLRRWMQATLAAVGLVLLLVVAAFLRLTHLNWDADQHYHPDERYIAWVATTIDWPPTWADAFKPTLSSFNPYHWSPDAHSAGIQTPQAEPRDFAYGHLPLYAGVAFTRLTEQLGPWLIPFLPTGWSLTSEILNARDAVEFHHLTLAARALTGVVDVGTVALVFWLGRRLFGLGVGLLAAAYLSLNVMHIQLAHFFASDPYQTFFVTACLLSLVVAVSAESHSPTRRAWSLVAAGVCLGLAVGSKFGAIFLLAPLGLAVFWWAQDQTRSRQRGLLMLGLVLLAALVAFGLTNPFALLDFTCEAKTSPVDVGPLHIPAVDLNSCFLMNIAKQSRMASGRSDLPFTRQYAGTTPFLYHVGMQIRWGMGPALGVVAFAGLAWAVWRAWRGWGYQRHTPYLLHPARRPDWIILAWVIPFFLFTGGLQVKFMRYMQPIVPCLMIYAAALIWQQHRAVWRYTLALLVLFFTGLYAAAFVRLYAVPHPWVEVSNWVYANVPPGALILTEQWDTRLPGSLTSDGVYYSSGRYAYDTLTWLTGADSQDDVAKLTANVNRLAAADYLIVASNRVYGVTPLLPQRYALSSQFYPLLFDGALGYELAYVVQRGPHLGAYYLKPDTFTRPGLTPPVGVAAYLSSLAGLNWGFVDESFTVYDQPLTMVFKNVGGFSAETLLAHFNLTP